MEKATELFGILQQRVGFDIVTKNVTDTQIRVMGRIQQHNIPSWLLVMEKLLTSAGGGWNIDISKQYLMRGQKLLYGWRIIIQGDNLGKQIDSICAAIASTPQVRRQLDEVALVAGPNRNSLRMGKGAQPVDKAIVGPLALATLNTGG